MLRLIPVSAELAEALTTPFDSEAREALAGQNIRLRTSPRSMAPAHLMLTERAVLSSSGIAWRTTVPVVIASVLSPCTMPGPNSQQFVARQIALLQDALLGCSSLTGHEKMGLVEAFEQSIATPTFCPPMSPRYEMDENRRAELRADLDVFFARKYGLSEEEQRYVLDPAKVKGADYPSETFRVLKEKEIRLYGHYRTERLVLEAWKRTEAKLELPSLKDVSDGVWAWAHGLDERDRARTQLRAMVGILPSAADARRIRLATLACLNPRLLSDFLSSSDQDEWQRIVGEQTKSNESVVTLTPPTNAAWGAAYNELVSAAVLDVSADGSEWSAGPRLDRSTLHVRDAAVGRALFAWSRLRSVDLEQGLTQIPAKIIPFIREGRLAA